MNISIQHDYREIKNWQILNASVLENSLEISDHHVKNYVIIVVNITRNSIYKLISDKGVSMKTDHPLLLPGNYVVYLFANRNGIHFPIDRENFYGKYRHSHFGKLVSKRFFNVHVTSFNAYTLFETLHEDLKRCIMRYLNIDEIINLCQPKSKCYNLITDVSFWKWLNKERISTVEEQEPLSDQQEPLNKDTIIKNLNKYDVPIERLTIFGCEKLEDVPIKRLLRYSIAGAVLPYFQYYYEDTRETECIIQLVKYIQEEFGILIDAKRENIEGHYDEFRDYLLNTLFTHIQEMPGGYKNINNSLQWLYDHELIGGPIFNLIIQYALHEEFYWIDKDRDYRDEL